MKLYLDFDSTLNNNDEAWCFWASEKFGKPVTREDMLDWDYMGRTFGPEVFSFFGPEAYIDHITPIPGAVEFIKEAQALYGADNTLVVTSSVPGTEAIKDLVLARDYGVAKSRVIHAKDKSPITVDGILVDDFPKNVIGHCLANRQPGIVFNYEGKCPIGDLDNYDYPDDASSLIYTAQSYGELLVLLEERRAA